MPFPSHTAPRELEARQRSLPLPSHWITRALQDFATLGTSLGMPFTSYIIVSGEIPIALCRLKWVIPSIWGYTWPPLQVEFKARTKYQKASLSCMEFYHCFCDIFTLVVYRSLFPYLTSRHLRASIQSDSFLEFKMGMEQHKLSPWLEHKEQKANKSQGCNTQQYSSFYSKEEQQWLTYVIIIK